MDLQLKLRAQSTGKESID